MASQGNHQNYTHGAFGICVLAMTMPTFWAQCLYITSLASLRSLGSPGQDVSVLAPQDSYQALMSASERFLSFISMLPVTACFSSSIGVWDPIWSFCGPPLAEASFVSLDVFSHLDCAIAGSWVSVCSSFKCCYMAPFLASMLHLFARFRGQHDVHHFSLSCTTSEQ